LISITSFTVRRFKRLQDITMEFGDSTVFVGANNSGKSSMLQAIHFGVALAQSSLLVGGVAWRQDRYELSFSPSDLLYTPVSDVMTLATGGNLVEDIGQRVEFIFRAADGNTCTIQLRRGRNRNIGVTLEGRPLGERLQSLTDPYSIYAPGLAGIPRDERYQPLGSVRKIVARGDANLVLRNVLHQLSSNHVAWNQFIDDMRQLFPTIDISVSFDPNTEESITATFSVDGSPELPLDAAGTGILQASQLLAYVALFQPRLLILDEPDSHMHPNNQRKLCALIHRLTQDREVQAIMCTHSRHVLDALRTRCKLVWMSQGTVVDGADIDTTKMLLDLGALDSVDYFADGQLRCLVATEDEKTDLIESVLWNSGFGEDDTQVISYSGCTKIDSAIVLGRFLQEKAPHVRLVIHKDRDYIADADIEQIRAALAAHNIRLFVTAFSDIEGYYLNAQHIVHLNPGLTEAQVNQMIVEARDAVADKSKEVIVNLRTQDAFRKRNAGGAVPNHGAIAVAANNEYDANPAQLMRGKVVLNRLKMLLQQQIGGHPVLMGPSPHQNIQELRRIADIIWPPAA
jgi:energy-coupling factor transporter ATP-binding protein EcfA2